MSISSCQYVNTHWLLLGGSCECTPFRHSYCGHNSTGVHLENTSWKHSSAAWTHPWFLKHSPFRRRITHLSSMEYSFTVAEWESAHLDEMHSSFTAAILQVWSVNMYYQTPPIGCALPFPGSSSFLQLTPGACWSRWNRSTCTSFPVMNE